MAKPSTQVYSLQGKAIRRIHLPKVFQIPIRPDVIRRAVIAIQSHRIQPQGRDVMAGKRTTAESRGVGYDLARVPRVKGSGFPKAGAGAFAPGTVGGREAHPPVAEKRVAKAINKRERRLALQSAIAATADKNLVTSRGHITRGVKNFPLVVTDELQKLKKASEARDALTKLGVWADILRVKERIKIRAGKGKRRGRRFKRGKGPLLVITSDEGICKAVSNYPGVDVVRVENLNAELLAPGTHLGRLTIWTEAAIKKLDELFT